MLQLHDRKYPILDHLNSSSATIRINFVFNKTLFTYHVLNPRIMCFVHVARVQIGTTHLLASIKTHKLHGNFGMNFDFSSLSFFDSGVEFIDFISNRKKNMPKVQNLHQLCVLLMLLHLKCQHLFI